MSEAAVRNAVIALGALAMSDEDNDHTAFALSHYSLAMKALQEKIPMQGSSSQYLVLVTCLLFVAFEFQHRGWAAAKQHLDSGLNIIRELQEGPVNASEALSSPSLVEAFERLDIQMSLFTSSRVHLSQLVQESYVAKIENEMHFRDVRDALRQLMLRMAAMREFMYCVNEAQTLSGEIPTDLYEDFQEQILRQSISLDHWESAMADLRKRLSRHRDQQAARILQMHHICCRLMVSKSLSDGQEALWDAYLPDFEKAIVLAEALSAHDNGLWLSNGGKKPHTFKLDVGVIAPVYFTASKSADLVISALGEAWC